MTVGDPSKEKLELARALAEVDAPAAPPKWVQICQMGLALLAFVGAFAVALILILHGPPAPKVPEAGDSGSSSESGKTTTDQNTALTLSSAITTSGPADGDGSEPAPDDSDEPSSDEPPTGDEPDEPSSTEEGGSEEGSVADSLANLNEQAPWAFAIVALLVGAFLATGKPFSLGGAAGAGNTENRGGE